MTMRAIYKSMTPEDLFVAQNLKLMADSKVPTAWFEENDYPFVPHTCRVLKVTGLRGHNFMMAVASSLARNRSVRSLCFTNGAFNRISTYSSLLGHLVGGPPITLLVFCDSGIRSFSAVADILMGLPKLRTLVLHEDLHEGMAPGDLAPPLRANCSLRKLDLNCCVMRTQDVVQILDALAENTNLRELRIGRFWCAAEILDAIGRMFRNNKTLERFSISLTYFSDNPFTKDPLKHIFRNRSITHLDISDLHVSTVDDREWCRDLSQNFHLLDFKFCLTLCTNYALMQKISNVTRRNAMIFEHAKRVAILCSILPGEICAEVLRHSVAPYAVSLDDCIRLMKRALEQLR